MRWVLILLSTVLLGGLVAVGGVLWGLHHFGRGLPDYKQLADYEPPVMTRVHAGDGRLLSEYARQRRVFVPIEAMPRRVIKAFLSAEDKNFYSHPGIDFIGLAKAMVDNVKNYAQNRRPRGASTITQQVAKNFLLTNEVSIERKAKEAILALRIERAISKDRILELYLNEIYLGLRSYGVAAAALNYFDKSLDELTVAESAYLAALPKAPNNYHPVRQHDAALARRNWVIRQMVENGFISPEDAEQAKAEPLTLRERSVTEVAEADYFAEEVRRWLVDRFGEDGLYEGGLSVRTTLDPKLQRIADEALQWGLTHYDRRHGWRGALGRIEIVAGWGDALAAFEVPETAPAGWRKALALIVENNRVQIGFPDGTFGEIPLAEITWAREWREGQRLGPSVKRASDVLAPGDVIFVEPVARDDEDKPYPDGTFTLRQIPNVDGGIVAMDPHTGRVLALSGGWNFRDSQFNRATQANRQPGSAFKPFVYLAALDNGFTPATRILDAPFVIDQGPGLGKWKPANYTKKFYGPSPMRLGIEKSRNLMTVRLAQTIGMDLVTDYARRFGIDDDMPKHLSMALGAGETTLLKMTTAYSMLVNGGKRVVPSLIDRVQDRNGRTIYHHDTRECAGCIASRWRGEPAPQIPDTREQVADPASAYQMVSMLEGVVQRGTGRRISTIGKPLAGKTGTTNDNVDTWFVGFTPDLAVGAFVGFDQPKTLGPRDTGSNVAAPIFKKFMEKALVDEPSIPFRIPPGVRNVRINVATGALAQPGDRDVMVEAFKAGTEPSGESEIVFGGDAAGWDARGPGNTAPVAGRGSGLY
ncbi:penicillin-binding protein 1A [Nisaea sp.]|uniref:penicillin-binding protein 1A n=1 Tax=Nisaea sp. TaxID=2024842 RepID=UPI003B52C5D0